MANGTQDGRTENNKPPTILPGREARQKKYYSSGSALCQALFYVFQAQNFISSAQEPCITAGKLTPTWETGEQLSQGSHVAPTVSMLCPRTERGELATSVAVLHFLNYRWIPSQERDKLWSFQIHASSKAPAAGTRCL